VSKVFDRRVARWRLPKITFHDTRHTWATLALQAGVHPKVVSDRLGHSSVAFTLDVYSHAIQGLDDDAAVRVADLIHKATHLQSRSCPSCDHERPASRLLGLLPGLSRCPGWESNPHVRLGTEVFKTSPSDPFRHPGHRIRRT